MRESAEDRILALASQGMRPCDVAEAVGRRPATVYHYLAAARRRGVNLPRFKTGSGWSGRRFLVAVDPSLKPGLACAAAKRGIDPRDLAARILTAVVEAGLIDAVLDDEGSDA